MSNIFYKPQDGYVGDVIPYYEDGTYYLFFLKDPRKTGRIADMTSWDLISTRDFVHYTEHGVALPAGKVADPDNCCYTGSVFKAGKSDYHIFYTAHNNYNPDYMKDGKPVQTIMHATSPDLIHWEKHSDRFGSDGVQYDFFDWRDPFVYYNEEENCYNMLLCARKAAGSFRRNGCVLKCRSKDLWKWEIGEPLYQPDAYMAHECPDLFCINGWWYLVYSTFTERFATHYRMSRSIEGPWTSRWIDTWDARAFYAAKTAGDDHKRYAFGWIPSREGRVDSGHYEWAGNLCVHELKQTDDGTLLVKMPDSVAAAFSQQSVPEMISPCAEVRREGADIRLNGEEKPVWAVFENLPKQCMIEAEISFDQPPRGFGVGLNLSMDLDDGYYYRFEPGYNRLVMDRWPRAPLSDRCEQQHYLGGDIPFQVELERPMRFGEISSVRIRVLIEDDIAVVYANDTTALCSRVYNLLNNRRWGFFAADGCVTVKGVRLHTM